MTGAARLGRERLECHQLADALHRHPGLLPGVEHLGELLDRGEEEVEVQDEGDEGTGREMAARDEPGTDAEHDRVPDVSEELHEGEVRADHPLGTDPGLEVGTPEAAEPGDAGLFVDEGLRLADARKAFLEIGVHSRDAVPRQLVGSGRLAPEHHGCHDQGAPSRRGWRAPGRN